MSNIKVCFFGHSDAPIDIKPKLKEILLGLIDSDGANEFYVGNHGNFDRMVIAVLSELSEIRDFRFYIVLAYPPTEKDSPYLEHTVLPDGIETVSPKFAINFRNKFMIETTDCVITYVKHSWGGAAKFKSLAERKNKKSLSLPDKNTPDFSTACQFSVQNSRPHFSEKFKNLRANIPSLCCNKSFGEQVHIHLSS